VIWAGSDDGLVQVTRNGGREWKNVTPPDVQPFTRINIIDASPHDPGTAYVAANRYQLDDVRPYIYKTTDFGRSWQPIVGGLPERGFVRTVREDPVKKDLLFAGTESAVYYSPDGGAHWQPLQFNMPVVPITDLTVKNDDLVAATQGRAFWVLDDITPLRALDDGATTARLFPLRDALRSRRAGFGRPVRASGRIRRWRRHHLRVANRTAGDHRVPRCQRRAREESGERRAQRPLRGGRYAPLCLGHALPGRGRYRGRQRFSPAATCAARSPHRGRIRCG
jgi:hypothetical protein